MITNDIGVADRVIYQVVCQGVEKFAKEFSCSAKVYISGEKDVEFYEKSMMDAVTDNVIVCTGKDFEYAVYNMQRMKKRFA